MISVLINSHRPDNAKRIHAHYSELLANDEHEIIIIADAKSVGEGYNRAVARSRGSIIVYSHDDIEVSALHRLWYVLHEEDYDLIGVAGASRIIGPSWIQAGPPHIHGRICHDTPRCQSVCIYGPTTMKAVAMDGVFLACKRKVAEAIPWDEQFSWHCADTDFSLRASLAGFSCGVVSDFHIIHASGGNYDSPEWRADAARFMAKHGDTLHKQKPRPFQFAAVEVPTKDEALEVMGCRE